MFSQSIKYLNKTYAEQINDCYIRDQEDTHQINYLLSI